MVLAELDNNGARMSAFYWARHFVRLTAFAVEVVGLEELGL